MWLRPAQVGDGTRRMGRRCRTNGDARPRGRIEDRRTRVRPGGNERRARASRQRLREVGLSRLAMEFADISRDVSIGGGHLVAELKRPRGAVCSSVARVIGRRSEIWEERAFEAKVKRFSKLATVVPGEYVEYVQRTRLRQHTATTMRAIQ